MGLDSTLRPQSHVRYQSENSFDFLYLLLETMHIQNDAGERGLCCAVAVAVGVL
jgi:hypothetical protein